MTGPVKRRPYDNTNRVMTSQVRRGLVLAAARSLFLERGYVRTTMSAIAEQADVSVDTVYELVGRKPELFRLLIETAISGEDHAVPAAERAYVQQIHDEPTAAGKLRVYADALPGLLARLAPLATVVQAAASAEPNLTDLWHEIGERRAQNMRRFAAELADTGDLAVPVDSAADVIWATNSTELYILLVDHRGWSHQTYSDWLAHAWQRLLLHPNHGHG